MTNLDPKGYYARLKVTPTVTLVELRAAYLRLAKQTHPDTNTSQNAKQEFQLLGEAYGVLCDADRRAAYDNSSHAPEQINRASAPKPSEKTNHLHYIFPATMALIVPIALFVAAEFSPGSAISSWQTARPPLSDSWNASWAAAKVPSCANTPSNGDALEESWPNPSIGPAHKLSIANTSGSDAIVKIRDSADRRVMATFFVANHSSAEYDFIPDGDYRIQYAFGDRLDAGCKTFVHIAGAAEFSGSQHFETTQTDTQIVVYHALSFTLHNVPNGGAESNAIAANAFNAP
jgi:curved DNA-binding protein CbpA